MVSVVAHTPWPQIRPGRGPGVCQGLSPRREERWCFDGASNAAAISPGSRITQCHVIKRLILIKINFASGSTNSLLFMHAMLRDKREGRCGALCAWVPAGYSLYWQCSRLVDTVSIWPVLHQSVWSTSPHILLKAVIGYFFHLVTTTTREY